MSCACRRSGSTVPAASLSGPAPSTATVAATTAIALVSIEQILRAHPRDEEGLECVVLDRVNKQEAVVFAHVLCVAGRTALLENLPGSAGFGGREDGRADGGDHGEGKFQRFAHLGQINAEFHEVFVDGEVGQVPLRKKIPATGDPGR